MSLLRRSGRFVFVGATNLFFVLPFVDYFCCSIWHYTRWYTIFDARRFWTFLAVFATLGLVLDIVQPRSARVVNVALWILFALKITGAFFSLWGSFAEDSWMAIFIVPLALSIAWVDFVLYRPRLAISPAEGTEGIK
jgi:hypothetical protein